MCTKFFRNNLQQFGNPNNLKVFGSKHHFQHVFSYMVTTGWMGGEEIPDSYNDLTAETMGHGLLGVRENLTLEAGISAKTATSVVLGL
jgi:hypothetical protein